jgi:nucleoside-diphosphate-sugar epimerase
VAQRALIIGPGYIGLPLAVRLIQLGHEVDALSRRGDVDGLLTAAGIHACSGDISNPSSLPRLSRRYNWVVNCVSSTLGTAEDFRRVYLEGTRNLVGWLSQAPPDRFVYTSSTGVYGQDDGSMVDEDSIIRPPTETGHVLAETEQVVTRASHERFFPGIVLRLAGIYGPGRGWWFKQFVAGEARIEGEGARMLNMIHRDDVLGCIIAALEHGRSGEIYNAVDDEPVMQRDFFAWLARKLNCPMPSSVPEDLGSARRRGATNKFVTNRKLKAELGYSFKFPTFREGYACEIRSLQGESG